MKKQAINIVWLKRDLRLQDHEPLFKAEKAELPYVVIYLFEPSLICTPDTSSRHLKFVYHSLLAMNEQLDSFRRKVEVFQAEALDAFSYLEEKFQLHNLFSYCETGTAITWN